jgi:hypothetical protein
LGPPAGAMHQARISSQQKPDTITHHNARLAKQYSAATTQATVLLSADTHAFACPMPVTSAVSAAAAPGTYEAYGPLHIAKPNSCSHHCSRSPKAAAAGISQAARI